MATKGKKGKVKRTSHGHSTDDFTVEDVEGSGQTTMLDLRSLQRANGQSELNYLQSNSELTINTTTSGYVHTEVKADVLDVLEEKNMVILKGHPGSGKSFQGHAILRQSRYMGYTPYVLSSFGEWHSHVGEGRKSVVLMDGVMGEKFVNESEHRQWTLLQSTVTELIKKGYCRLVLTVYPHILRRLKQMEKNPHSLLSDPSFTVSLPGTLNPGDKERLLCVHLHKLQLSTETKQRMIDTIVEKDTSGPVFGWCCDWLVHNWESLGESSQSVDACAEIFTQPAEAYVSLLRGMLLDPDYGDVLAAVLSLTMLGFVRYLHQPLQAKGELKRLGFRNISDDDLASVADLLQEFILTRSADGFVSRIFYDAAGIALGRSHRQPVLLTVCDFTFILQYVRTVETVGPFSVTLGFGDFDGLSERLLQSILDGRAPIACLHPDLSNKKFLEAFIRYCETQKNLPQKFANVLDTTHHLPLLYWSVWSVSDRLCKWCLSTFAENVKTGSKELLSVILGVLVFCPTNQVKSNMKEILIKLLPQIKTMHKNIMAMRLPFPSTVLTPEARIRAESIKTFLQDYGVCYLNNPSLCIPHTLLSLAVKEEAVEIEMPVEHMHLILRLLTDCEVDDTDGDGNTLLHLAAAAGNLEVINMAVKSGASITLKNKAGHSPQDMGHRRRRQRTTATLKLENNSQMLLDILRACQNNDTETVKAFLCNSVNVEEFHKLNPCIFFTGKSLFHEACEAGAFDVTSLLIELGADVHSRYNDDNKTALHYICQSKRSDTVKLLLDRGAEVNASDSSKQTALHYACKSGVVDTVKLLLERGAEVNASDIIVNTALHTASMHGNTDIIKLLLEKGGDINKKNKDGSTPLDIACQFGKTQTASLLISHRADVSMKNTDGDTPLHSASKNGCVETLKLVLDCGGDINVQNNDRNSALHTACQYGQTQTASLLIKHGAKVSMKNKDGDTPLHCTSKNGCVDTVKLVLDRGGDINAQNNGGNKALHTACQYGKTETASLLINHSAKVSMKNKDGDTPLHLASENGHVETVKLISDKRGDLHAKNNNGDTPLHYASYEGDHSTVRVLLQLGADANATNNNGETSLHYASCNKKGAKWLHSAFYSNNCRGEVEQTLLELLKNGANVNTRDKNGNTALHTAFITVNGWHRTLNSAVCVLLNHGAEVNIQNADGNTPLHLACKAPVFINDLLDTIKSLLQHGADPRMKNARGLSPIDLTSQFKFSSHRIQEDLLKVLRAQRTSN